MVDKILRMAYCCGNIGFDGNPAHTVGPYDMYDKILGGFGMILLPRGTLVVLK